MNNETKILALLEQIQQEQATTNERLTSLERGQKTMKKDIAAIKEDTEITRSTANALVAWADNVSVITQVKFPVGK